MRRFPAILVAVALAAGAGVVRSQEPVPPPDEPLVNFVFASQLGSGVYASGDAVVQVYRIPISWTAIPPEDRRWGLRLRFPVTLGFYDFRSRDLLDLRIPDHVSTVTLSTVAEIPVALGPRWTVTPTGEVGYARDFTQDVGSALYAVGTRGTRTQAFGAYRTAFDARLVWAGQANADRALADDFLRLETAYEVGRPIPGSIGSKRLDASGFVASYVYFDSAGFFRFPDPVTTGSEGVRSDATTVLWEVGATLGLEPSRWGWLPLPRVGISYRFGDDASIWRLVFGGPF